MKIYSGDRGDRGGSGGAYSGSSDAGGPGGRYSGSSDAGGPGGRYRGNNDDSSGRYVPDNSGQYKYVLKLLDVFLVEILNTKSNF